MGGRHKRSAALCLAGLVIQALGGWAQQTRALDPAVLAEGQQGVQLFEQGQYEEALAVFRRMERKIPTDYQVTMNMGLCFEHLNDLENAEKYFRKSAKAMPTNPDVFSTLGSLYVRTGQVEAALKAYSDAISLVPKARADQLYFNRGNAHQAHGDHYSAAQDFATATSIRPDNYQAWNNMGSAYMSLSENDRAIHALRKTLTFIPTHPIPLTNLVITENRICEWGRKKKHNALLRKALHEQLKAGDSLVVPFHAFEFNFTASECRQNAEMWSRRVDARAAYLVGFDKGGLALKNTRLRIGYVSGSGFHNSTTTARSMRSQYAMHNRMYVEVFCYAAMGDDRSEVRATIRAGCDHFVEMYGKSHQEMAQRMRDDEINVLIDTTGYTMNMCTEVFAIGPSPIQVQFHGFPGTMGAEFMHYLAADRYAAPADHAQQFSERLMLLPNTYLTNDHRQSRREVYLTGTDPVHGPAPTRAEFGFSEDDVILCSFNQLYKIEPRVFATWMRILKRVPRAKLWLLRFTEQGVEKLRKSAGKLGVDPTRLVFHDQFPREREFRIKGLAELFLDTPLFNAHTTAGDVLWSGVPILTLPGENFAQRVASGMLRSARLEDVLIAPTLEEYEALAVALATREGVRGKMRARLRSQRENLPLFDIQRLTSEYERGLLMSWDVHDAYGAPFNIVVSGSAET